jgi:hypothetical protein
LADDRTQRGAADAARININEEHELRYWAKALNVPEAELREV